MVPAKSFAHRSCSKPALDALAAPEQSFHSLRTALTCTLNMQKEQQQLQQANSSYDDAEPWHLPIGHRVEDSLDTDGIAMASKDTAIPDSNKGFQMLQKMGWKGTGLGRHEDGEHASSHVWVCLRAAPLQCPHIRTL